MTKIKCLICIMSYNALLLAVIFRVFQLTNRCLAIYEEDCCVYVGDLSYKVVFNWKAFKDILLVARSCNYTEFLFCGKGIS